MNIFNMPTSDVDFENNSPVEAGGYDDGLPLVGDPYTRYVPADEHVLTSRGEHIEVINVFDGLYDVNAPDLYALGTRVPLKDSSN